MIPPWCCARWTHWRRIPSAGTRSWRTSCSGTTPAHIRRRAFFLILETPVPERSKTTVPASVPNSAAIRTSAATATALSCASCPLHSMRRAIRRWQSGPPASRTPIAARRWPAASTRCSCRRCWNRTRKTPVGADLKKRPRCMAARRNGRTMRRFFPLKAAAGIASAAAASGG